MDQRSSKYLERGTTILEVGLGQLHAEPHVQLISELTEVPFGVQLEKENSPATQVHLKNGY